MHDFVECGFVVLHYQTYEMTEQCVSAVLDHLGSQEIFIVVVDNGSPNGSGALLRERFSRVDKVEVVLNDENLGFARGNNVGYAWLKQHCDPNYIVVMNNDVLIEQESFIEHVQNAYQSEGFAVLGPDIYEPGTGQHRNPYRTSGYRKEEAVNLLRSMHTWDKFFPYRYWRLRAMSRSKSKQDVSADSGWHNVVSDCMLQGSCYVFSREYISVRSIAFCPDTFLYFEEAILWRDCEKLGLRMLYWPWAKVTHLGSVSTKLDAKSNYLREKKKNRAHFESVQVYVDRYDSMDVCDR